MKKSLSAQFAHLTQLAVENPSDHRSLCDLVTILLEYNHALEAELVLRVAAARKADCPEVLRLQNLFRERRQKAEERKQSRIEQAVLEEGNGDFEFHRYHAQTDALIVPFTSLDVTKGIANFEFKGITADLPAHRLYVRDKGCTWYNGIGKTAPTPQDLAGMIDEYIDRLQIKNCVLVGASMGGYGALLTASLMKRTVHVIALAPQTFIQTDMRARFGERRWYEHEHKYPAHPYPDLLPRLRNGNPDMWVDLYQGYDDYYDCLHHVRLMALPHVRIVGIPGGHHAVGLPFKNSGFLKRILQQAVIGKDASNIITELGGALSQTQPAAIAHIRQALIYLEQHNPQACFEDTQEHLVTFLTAALQDDKNIMHWAAPRLALAGCLFRKRDYGQAMEHLEAVIDLLPQPSKIYTDSLLQLAQCYKIKRRYQDGLDAVFKALLCEPASPGGRLLKVQLLEADGQYEHALSLLDDMLKQSPQNPALSYQKAIILYHMGEYGQAVPLLKNFLQIRPDHSWAWYYQAACAFQQQDLKEAEQAIKRCLELHPNNMKARQLLADCTAALSDAC